MNVMNTGVGSARVGEWYVRWDIGELFQVTGQHPERHTNSIESFAGETYEIDDHTWSALPLALVRPPDGWTTDLQSSASPGVESCDGTAEEVEPAQDIAEEIEPAEDIAEGIEPTDEIAEELEPTDAIAEELTDEPGWASPLERPC